jgi:anti-anti-sigma factor
MPLTLQSRFVGNVYVIRCAGRIVLGPEVTELESVLNTAAFEFSRFVLTVADIDRLDSIGIGLLVRFAERLRRRGGDIRLAAPPPFLTKLLELTKLSKALQAFATEEEAILSFLLQRPADATQRSAGPRVLVIDESADLCVFVRTVLRQYGFDVQSSCLVRDARILLQVDDVDYILVGPGIVQGAGQTILRSLTPLAPKAVPLQLEDDFKIRDAHEATQALLQMFNLQSTA